MKRRSMPTHRSGRAWLVGIGLAVGLILGAGGSGLSAANAGMATTSTKFFKVCDGTAADGTPVPHGLCAVASCFVLNKLAYCECDVASGDSISLPFKFDSEQDICTVNAAGVGNGYMASTFSFPPSVSHGDRNSGALHVPAARLEWNLRPVRRRDLFHQCAIVSGFWPVAGGQIICSCPIASPGQARLGYQIPGPYPCQKKFFENCGSAAANTNTGSTIYSGAPIGSAAYLTKQLYGYLPPINQCFLQHD